MELNKTYYENALVTMERMGGPIVDLTVTSPPYDDLRTCYAALGFSDFEKIADGLYRVTKNGGVLVWVVADQVKGYSETGTSFRQALHFMKIGFLLHDTMIYKKLNFSHPERSRYHSTFEYMFVFSKGKPKNFNPIKDRRNITSGQVGSVGKNTYGRKDGTRGERDKKVVSEFGMRHNVWEGKTRGQEEMGKPLPHEAMMPKWIARDQIISWSNPGELIYDPFGGSGTTGQEAEKLGRNWIMSELKEEYGKG